MLYIHIQQLLSSLPFIIQLKEYDWNCVQTLYNVWQSIVITVAKGNMTLLNGYLKLYIILSLYKFSTPLLLKEMFNCSKINVDAYFNFIRHWHPKIED